MKTLIHWRNWRRWKLEHEKMAQMAADINSWNLQYFWKSLYEEATGRTEMTSPTLFCKKVTGCCRSVLLLLIPAPEALAVSAPRPKKVQTMVSIDECHTPTRFCTVTLGNFAKVTFDAISNTYSNLTPDFWKETVYQVSLSRIHWPSCDNPQQNLFRSLL